MCVSDSTNGAKDCECMEGGQLRTESEVVVEAHRVVTRSNVPPCWLPWTLRPSLWNDQGTADIAIK